MSLLVVVATVNELSATSQCSLDKRKIRRIDKGVLAEMTLTLAALACEDVATVGLLTLELSGTGHLEPLLRT